jgi:arylsulfatase
LANPDQHPSRSVRTHRHAKRRERFHSPITNWFVYQFWRFVFVQQQVAVLAQTAIDFPPMQKGASFNLEAVKQQIDKAITAHAGK